MEFIGARMLRLKPGDVWKKLRAEKELVITTNGKPVGLLMPVDASHLEESLLAVRRAKAELAVTKLRRVSASGGLDRLSDHDIAEEIRAARKARLR